MSASRPFDFRQLVDVAARRGLLALVVFAAVFAVTGSVVVALPDVYRSTTTLLVESQQVPQEFVRSTVTSAVERRVQSIGQSMMSRTRLRSLIEAFGLYGDLKGTLSEEEIIERMRKDVAVELRGVDARGGSNSTIAFSISYLGSDPRKVAAVANALASSYIDEDLKTRERQAGGTAEFLKSQLDEIQKKLALQEGQVSEYKELHMGELPEQREGNLSVLERLNAQALFNTEKQLRAREKRALLQRQLAGADSSAAVPGSDAAMSRIARLSGQLAELRRTYSDKYPDVVALQAEIARLQSRPAGAPPEPDAAAAPADRYAAELAAALKAADGEIRILQAEEAQIRKQTALYQQRVENAPRREQEFQELSRDYRTTQDVYASLLKRYEESKIAESMEHRQKGEQFRVLDPAIPADRPAAPNRPRLLVASLVVALGLAAAAAALAEHVDTSFHDVDDLRAFAKVPVLATIPSIVTAADLRRRRGRRLVGAAVVAASLALLVVGGWAVGRGNQRLVTLVSGGASTRR